MKKTVNQSHIEGLLYEHDLTLKESGPNSKTPGTKFISGTVSIATDNNCVNVVPVHYTYVTQTTSKGNTNNNFTILEDIINGKYKTVMKDGKDIATKISIDSTVGLNEFFSTQNSNEPTLVSVKRNEGGFIHILNALAENENDRNTFKTDMLITSVKRIEADPEKNLPEKGILKGWIFDYKNALLPVEYTVYNDRGGIDYFESMSPSNNNPFFTQVWGNQVSETVVRTTVTESAFGDDAVRTTTSVKKDFVVLSCSKYPYEWDDESTMTAIELKEAMANRETYLATIKQRRDEYQASKANVTPAVATGKPSTFNF